MSPFSAARSALELLRLRVALPLVFGRQGMRELLERLDANPARPEPSASARPERRRAAPESKGSGRAERSRAAELERLVARSFRPFRFWRTTCLWRALAGYTTLRAAGEDVRLLIGVRAAPGGDVEAHAWLERAGAPSIGAPPAGAGYQVAFAWPANPGTLPARSREDDVAGLSPSDDAVLTELRDGTGVLLHLGTRFYFTLNRTGVLVWKLLEGGAREGGAIAAGVAAEFPDVDPATIGRDVDALLAELRTEGLVAERS